LHSDEKVKEVDFTAVLEILQSEKLEAELEVIMHMSNALVVKGRLLV